MQKFCKYDSLPSNKNNKKSEATVNIDADMITGNIFLRIL